MKCRFQVYFRAVQCWSALIRSLIIMIIISETGIKGNILDLKLTRLIMQKGASSEIFGLYIFSIISNKQELQIPFWPLRMFLRRIWSVPFRINRKFQVRCSRIRIFWPKTEMDVLNQILENTRNKISTLIIWFLALTCRCKNYVACRFRSDLGYFWVQIEAN